MGSGFKTFVTGPLSAADMNNFLMKQAVIDCTSTTRPSAPEPGMTIHETDTKKFRFWSGTGWRHLGPSRLVFGPAGGGLNFGGATGWTDTGVSCSITTATEQVQVALGLTGDVSVSAAGGGGMLLGVSMDTADPVATSYWIYDNIVGLRLPLPVYLGDLTLPAPGAHTVKLWRSSPSNGGTYSLNNTAFRCQVPD